MTQNFAPAEIQVSDPHPSDKKPDTEKREGKRKGLRLLLAIVIFMFGLLFLTGMMKAMMASILAGREAKAADIENQAQELELQVNDAQSKLTSANGFADTKRIASDSEMLEKLLDASVGWSDKKAAQAEVVKDVQLADSSQYLAVMLPDEAYDSYTLDSLCVADIQLDEAPNWDYLYVAFVTVNRGDEAKSVIITFLSDGTEISAVDASEVA